MNERELDLREKEKLTRQLSYLTNEHNKLIKTTVRLLSDESANIALGTLPNGEIYYYGIANLLRYIDSDFMESALDAIEAIDNFEQYRDLLSSELDGRKVYIGRENPIKEMDNYTMLISDYKIKNWGRGVICVIGSKRMPYQKVIPLLTYVSDFLSGRI
jgi:heat-inducible transcriptional repressor